MTPWQIFSLFRGFNRYSTLGTTISERGNSGETQRRSKNASRKLALEFVNVQESGSELAASSFWIRVIRGNHPDCQYSEQSKYSAVCDWLDQTVLIGMHFDIDWKGVSSF